MAVTPFQGLLGGAVGVGAVGFWFIVRRSLKGVDESLVIIENSVKTLRRIKREWRRFKRE